MQYVSLSLSDPRSVLFTMYRFKLRCTLNSEGGLCIGILLMALPLTHTNRESGMCVKCILSEPTTKTQQTFQESFDYVKMPRLSTMTKILVADALSIEDGKKLTFRMGVTVVGEGKPYPLSHPVSHPLSQPLFHPLTRAISTWRRRKEVAIYSIAPW